MVYSKMLSTQAVIPVNAIVTFDKAVHIADGTLYKFNFLFSQVTSVKIERAAGGHG
jgi:hypothetical protein